MVVDLLDICVCVLGIKIHMFTTVLFLQEQIIFLKSTLNLIFYCFLGVGGWVQTETVYYCFFSVDIYGWLLTTSKIFVKTVFSKVCKIFVSECKIIQNLRKNFVFKGNAKSLFLKVRLSKIFGQPSFPKVRSSKIFVKTSLSKVM